MATTDLNAIIASLHGGVFDNPPWKPFLEQVRVAVDAGYAGLAFRQRGVQIGSTIISAGSAGDLDPAHLQAVLARANLPYEDLTPDRPYALSEIVDTSNAGHREYMRYLKARGIDYAFAIPIREPGGGSGCFSVTRRGSDFAPWVREFLVNLAPHISLAARTRAALEHERMRSDLANAAVRRLNFGWVALDARGAVIELDDAARRLFSSCTTLRGVARGQNLPLTGPARRALLDTVAEFASNPDLPARAIHILDEPWIDMLTAPVRHNLLASGLASTAVGYVHVSPLVNEQRYEQLKRLFSLTENEARLAIALSQGKSISEAARELALTLETARNYTKRIYAKTDTRGQVDLVRLILESVIALA